MPTLYETLNEIVEEDVTKRFSPEQIQEISDDMTRKVKKKLGNKEYKNLEQYITVNKDNKDLKELTGYLLVSIGIKTLLPQLLTGGDEARTEIMTGYKLTISLHKTLKKCKYDTEKALLEVWGK